jgi:hypothetical protein
MGIFDKISKYAEDLISDDSTKSTTDKSPNTKETLSEQDDITVANNDTRENKLMDKGAKFILGSSQKIMNLLLGKYKLQISYFNLYDPDIISYVIEKIENSEFNKKNDMSFELINLSTNSLLTIDYCFNKLNEVRNSLEQLISELQSDLNHIGSKDSAEYEITKEQLAVSKAELESMQSNSFHYKIEILKKLKSDYNTDLIEINFLLDKLYSNDPEWSHYLIDKYLFEQFLLTDEKNKAEHHYLKAIHLNPLDKDLLQKSQTLNDNYITNQAKEILELLS